MPRKVHEKTIKWYNGTSEEKLTARACGLVFLINKLTGSNNEIGIKATIGTLADLLVEDLISGGGNIRGQLPALLDSCELLMKVGDEYRIQTEESSAWNDEFISQRARLSNESHRVDSERDDRIRSALGTITNGLNIQQGQSKVVRAINIEYNTALPADTNKKVYVWVRDGWSTDENSVRADARQAGLESPTIFVFIPKRSADDLRHQILDFKASSATLEKRGVPNTPEGVEARASMETTKQFAEKRIKELVSDSISGARVFQAGGNEVLGDNLKSVLKEAADNSVKRLYPQFGAADHPNWSKVYEKAQHGAPDALREIGDQGEPANNIVCKTLQSYIGPGKKGADIRSQFEDAQYGWPRDAIDGALQVLLVAGLIKAQDDMGRSIRPTDLVRNSIGRTIFKIESTTVSTIQRLQVRSLFQSMDVIAVAGDELKYVEPFINKIEELVGRAGGEAPQPERPDISDIKLIKLASGNEQLIALHAMKDDIASKITVWHMQAEKNSKRLPNWQILKRLMKHAEKQNDIEILATQVKAIEDERQLLSDPDPVAPIISSVTQLLRTELNRLNTEFGNAFKNGTQQLESDPNWQQLEPEQREMLLNTFSLNKEIQPKIEVQNTDFVLKTLENYPISILTDRLAAMSSRFNSVLVKAAELCVPEVQFMKVPQRTVKTDAEIESWIAEVRQKLISALPNGPIVIQ